MSEERHETQNTDEAICPYCGHVESDTWEMRPQNDDESDEVDCGACDEKYEITTHISATVSTQRMDCANGDHVYGKPHRNDYEKGWQCTVLKNPRPPKEKAGSIWGRNCIYCEEMDVESVEYKAPMPKAWEEAKAPDTNA